MFKNWIESYKRKTFLETQIQKLVDQQIQNFTTTEATDSINSICNYEYTRLEVIAELIDAGFCQTGSAFEWVLSNNSIKGMSMKGVDRLILLMMYAFMGFAFYLLIIQIFG